MNKRIQLILFILIFPIVTVASPSLGKPLSFEKGMSSPKKDKGTHINVWIPGFLFKSIGKLVSSKDKESELLQLLPGNTHLKVLSGGKKEVGRTARNERKYDRCIKRGRYQKMIGFKSKGKELNVATRRKRNGKVKVILVFNTNNTFVYLKSKGRLSPEKLAAIAKRFS